MAASFSSHASSAASVAADGRQPESLSSALRWRMTRSSSSTRSSRDGSRATTESSMNARRTDAEPLTSERSSGENTVVRSTESRSRVRTTRLRLTCATERPTRFNSISMRNSRPSSPSSSARTNALSAPLRTTKSLLAPRNDFIVESTTSASARFVLPCALRPTSATTPPSSDNESCG